MPIFKPSVAALLVLAPLLLGWDHVLSPDAFFAVNPRVAYSQVKRDPAAYRGTTLMLGGRVVDNATDREGTTLEIQCYALDVDDKPEEPDEACGRFLAKTSIVLDPDLFTIGRLVTLTGKVLGRETLPLGDSDYEYIAFEMGEIHLWPRPVEPWPYYRRYFYDPYWDPFYGPYGRYGWWYRRRYRGW
jgi:outer membrane lipoprotein